MSELDLSLVPPIVASMVMTIASKFAENRYHMRTLVYYRNLGHEERLAAMLESSLQRYGQNVRFISSVSPAVILVLLGNNPGWVLPLLWSVILSQILMVLFYLTRNPDIDRQQTPLDVALGLFLMVSFIPVVLLIGYTVFRGFAIL